MTPQQKTRRGGVVDLFLVALVVLAVGLRTPLGSLGAWAVAKARGETREAASLVASFTTGVHNEVVTKIQAIVDSPDVSGVGEGPFPEPYRTAVAVVLGKDELRTLDAAHVGTNPEATLEIHALGVELRERAIQRATSAGEPDPESYASYRRYLPAKAQKEGDRVVAGTIGAAKMLELAWPVQEDHRLTSPYGYRTHPVLGTRKLHNGVDLAVPEGTVIVAAQDATVSVAGEDDVNGKYIVLDHGYGVKTSYCHLSELEVEGGDEVERGSEIALSGNTGRSTGPHLHFVLRIGKQTVDPERFKPADTEVADLF